MAKESDFLCHGAGWRVLLGVAVCLEVCAGLLSEDLCDGWRGKARGKAEYIYGVEDIRL